MPAVSTARTQHGDRGPPLSPDYTGPQVRTLTSKYRALGVCQVLFVFCVLMNQIFIRTQCYYYGHFTDGEIKIICWKSELGFEPRQCCYEEPGSKCGTCSQAPAKEQASCPGYVTVATKPATPSSTVTANRSWHDRTSLGSIKSTTQCCINMQA